MELAIIIASYALAAARLLSLPGISVLWDWVPLKWQPLLFGLPQVLMQLASALGMVTTTLGMVEAFGAALIAVLIALRGGQQQTPPGSPKAPTVPPLPLIVLSLFMLGCAPGAASADSVCAKEAAAGTARCLGLGLAKCGAYKDDPEACPDKAEVDAECERFIDEELQKCEALK